MATTKVKTPKAVTVTKAKAEGITAPLYNLKAEKIGDITLPKKFFEAKISADLISHSVRAFLANHRRAHAKVKDRGEVSGTTKKMWAQKGTGRARHGSAKAGIFVGGGSVHGPRGNQVFSLSITKSAKKSALNSILSRFAKEGRILVIDDFKPLAPKTKDANTFMDLLEKGHEVLSHSHKIGVIAGKYSANVTRAFRNIPGINPLALDSLNVHDLSLQNILIFSQNAIETLK